MNEKIADFEAKRLKYKKNELTFLFIGLIVCALGVGMYFLFNEIIITIAAVIIGLLLIAIPRVNTSRFAKKIKNEIMSIIVKDTLGEDALYNATQGISLNKILQAGIYQYPDRYHLEDYISAKYNDVSYEMCDARFQEEHIHRDSKGNTTVSYETYFSGRVIIVDFKRNLDFCLKIIEGRPKGLIRKGLEDVETEVIDFNKKYKTYVSDKEKAYYILTPVFIRKLLEIEKKFRGTIQFCINHDYFYCFINNNVDSLEFNMSKKFDAEQIEIIKSQIMIGATIINEFGLDSNKFNNEF